MKIKKFEEIKVWQLARQLTRKVYQLIKKPDFYERGQVAPKESLSGQVWPRAQNSDYGKPPLHSGSSRKTFVLPSRSQASNKVRSIDLVVYYLKGYEEQSISNQEPLPKASLWENGEPNNLSIYKIRIFFVGLAFFFLSCSSDYDLVIKGGTVYDGLGNEAFTANIAVKDGRIMKIGKFAPDAPKIINAEGLIVSPGFIDMHTHIDGGILKPGRGNVENYLFQGVTTVVTGNCGSGTWQVKELFGKLDSIGIGLNMVHLIGHGTIRGTVMGQDDRDPNPVEMAKMKKLIAQGMSEGALGLSTGLFYAPGSFSNTEEIIELVGTLKEYNGLYATHIRDESNYTIGLLESIKEAIEIGEKSEVDVQISHIKALGTPVWNLSDEVCSIIEKAQERGINVMADQYPYVASSTSLAAAVIPRWVQEGGRMNERLQDPELIEKIKTEIGENISRRGGPESLVIVSYKPNRDYDGLNLSEISSLMDKSAIETAISLVINGGPSIISFNMNSDDVACFMKKGYVMTSSDGSVQIPGLGMPHPRSYGTFPHKIRKYVLEDDLISMEHAIRAATFLPAQMLGLSDRGQISEGYVADIVVFDPKTIRDVAAFGDPHQYSKGIFYLLVSGQIVIENEKYNGKLVGKTLRMNDYRKSRSKSHL